MKVFELQHPENEKTWITGKNVIDAIKEYLFESSVDISEIEDCDIVEVPESEWDKITVVNNDYDDSDPNDFREITVKDFMKYCDTALIICGTMYD